MKRIYLLLALLLAVSSTAFAQSKTVKEFSEKAEGYNAFLYQSLIRMLNKDANPDFNMLIRDLDHIRILTTEEGDANARSTFQTLDKGVQGEGFESIMSFDNAEYRCHVYELSANGGKSTWVATLFMDGAAGVIEMKGSLDLKYLQAFDSMDMDKLKELVPMEGIE